MTAVIERTDTGYSAYVEEVPGVGVAGETMEETVRLLRGALVMHFEGEPDAIPLCYKTRNNGGTLMITSTYPVVAEGHL
jgi:predicted RNase H-like HicB family nuclease